VQKQVLDTGGFQFAFVFPQFSYDCGLIHTAALRIFSRIFEQARNHEINQGHLAMLPVGATACSRQV